MLHNVYDSVHNDLRCLMVTAIASSVLTSNPLSSSFISKLNTKLLQLHCSVTEVRSGVEYLIAKPDSSQNVHIVFGNNYYMYTLKQRNIALEHMSATNIRQFSSSLFSVLDTF